MINEVVIFGEILEHHEYIMFNAKRYLQIIVLIERPFPSSNGIRVFDEIKCLLWKGEAERFLFSQNTCKHISIKGRVEIDEAHGMMIIAEKIKYISL